MKWTVWLNKNTYINVSRSTTGYINIETVPVELKKFLNWKEYDGKILFAFGEEVFAVVSINRVAPIYLRSSFTTLELKNIMELSNKGAHLFDSYAYVKNQETFENGKEKKLTSGVETELHTHFLEMLTGEELLRVLFKYIYKIPVYDGVIPGKLRKGERLKEDLTVEEKKMMFQKGARFFKFLRKDEIIEQNLFHTLAGQLSVPIDRQIPYEEMEEIATRRGTVVTMAARAMALRDGKDPYNDNDVALYRGIIYVEILKSALKGLKDNGVKYVEFSYSTPKTIELIHSYYVSHPEEFEEIVLGILFSFSRNVKKDRQTIGNIGAFKSLVNKGIVKGFDLMGLEHGVTRADMKDESDPKSLISIIREVLMILDGKSEMVLRLHAGENSESIGNPLRSLQVIDKLVDIYGFELPQIRIGHGLYFARNLVYSPKYTDEYASLLRRYGVIVEINATSNFSLTNIRDISFIPYKWYVEQGIPIVLATDGAGMYLTNALQEKMIAELFGGEKVLENVSNSEKGFVKR